MFFLPLPRWEWDLFPQGIQIIFNIRRRGKKNRPFLKDWSFIATKLLYFRWHTHAIYSFDCDKSKANNDPNSKSRHFSHLLFLVLLFYYMLHKQNKQTKKWRSFCTFLMCLVKTKESLSSFKAAQSLASLSTYAPNSLCYPLRTIVMLRKQKWN